MKQPRAQVIHGDCLTVLPTVRRRFDLVYVDPPFNAGGKRRAREGKGARVDGPAAYVDAWGGLDSFLAMLGPRLAAVRDTMTEQGSLWLHLDHRTVHDAKLLADHVFGRSAFRGEVIWVPGNGAKKRSGPSVTHQTILIYARSKKMIWNIDDPALREPFAQTSLRMHFRAQDADGRAFRERVINGKPYRYYADAGRRIGSVWTDCPAMNANTPLTRETTGYPTQKPEALLRRIVLGASLPTSHVLDPMCGSGTTLAAAVRAGRRALGIDQSELGCSTTRQRIAALD